MTNYEKIKSMSVNEMAEFLDDNFTFSCETCHHGDNCVVLEYSDECRKALKKWLKAESEED